MGCFLACFGSSKDRRRKCRKHQHHQHKKHNNVHPRYQKNAADQDLVQSIVPVEDQIGIPEKPVIISTALEEEIQEEEKDESTTSEILRKRVTFDSNVMTYEPPSVKESAEFLPQEEEEPDITINTQTQSQSDVSSETSSATSSSTTSYPSNHRYQNYRDSDDELDLEDDQSDSDSDDDDGEEEEDDYDYEDMYDDDPSNRFTSLAAANEEGKAGRNRSGYVHQVLNPVENLSQWKAVKSKKTAAQLKPIDKENHEQEPSFKVKKANKAVNQEEEEKEVVAVDASLSNWLSATSSLASDCTTPLNKQQQQQPTATTPERSYSASPNSFEDRPILGALTVEEIRQMSASNSPFRRRSPGGGHSPEDEPIIGSVGSYWSDNSSKSEKKLQRELSSGSSSFKGIPNTTSKYREVG
ncbi:hypothetical protein LINPERHAP2_LOCUS41816 [Linum perenne]